MKYQVINQNNRNIIINIKEIFNKNNNLLFKGRNIIKIINHNNKNLVVKSFKVPNLINQIAYRYIRDSKAKRSYLNSIKLQKLKINTPEPIGYIEFGRFTLQESFYISKYFEHDFEIRAVLNDKNFEDRKQILKEFTHFSYELHNKGVYHIDYSPGNILIKKDTDKYIFAIIDVNRMKFINFDNNLRFKNLAKISNKQEDLSFIAKEYAKVSGIDTQFAINTLLKYHNEHQAYLQRKAKLKSIKK